VARITNAQLLDYLKNTIQVAIAVNTEHLRHINSELAEHREKLEEHEARLGEHEVALATLNQEQEHHSINWARALDIMIHVAEAIVIALLLARLR